MGASPWKRGVREGLGAGTNFVSNFLRVVAEMGELLCIRRYFLCILAARSVELGLGLARLARAPVVEGDWKSAISTGDEMSCQLMS